MPNFVRTTVDPGRLITISNNIGEDIRKVESAIKQVQQTLTDGGSRSLKGTWQGPASSVFYKQLNEDKEIFESYLEVLQKLNNQLKEAAGIYDRADNKVQDLIKRLKIG